MPPDLLLLSLAHSLPTEPSSRPLGLVHWNPHWQCFGNATCTAGATNALAAILATPVDFANVVELEDKSWKPPAGWGAVGRNESCGDPYGDWDTLFYDERRWRLKRGAVGCLTPSRSFAAGVFAPVSAEGGLQEVTVFGAHFPQTLNASTGAYAAATAAVRRELRALGWRPHRRLVFMGDTNTEGPEAAAANASHHGVNRTDAQLMADMGVHAAPLQASPLFRSCCYSDAFSWQGDRIIATFGRAAHFEPLFDPTPAWAAFPGSEFHRGVRLSLALP